MYEACKRNLIAALKSPFPIASVKLLTCRIFMLDFKVLNHYRY